MRYLLLVGVLVLGYLAGAFVHGSSADDAIIIEVLAEENGALTEQNEIQKKLIDTHEAERQEISNAINPA